MSLASKLTFLGSIVFASATVLGVHLQQKFERDRMHQGVLHDQHRSEAKKQQKENQLDFERHQALETILKNEQTNMPPLPTG
ncbi:hypothetical protein HMI54_005242 [Coelomomyces lativittatus]|nr:hypothetical protein HMI55_001850 [Coelomomyces lativittatus]KAJ1517537.1 hypothetical protein HMI54_005242 [Coelomomyces lativittatus]